MRYDFLFWQIVNNSCYSVYQFLNVEIDDKAKVDVLQTKVGEELLFVDGSDFVFGFVVDNNFLFNYQIKAEWRR